MTWERPRASTSHERVQVLILEDDKDWQDILSDIVVETGFQPITVDNLKIARMILHNQKIDVVVLDLFLKQKKGVPAQGPRLLKDVAKLHQSQELKKGPLVIVVSGSPQAPNVMKIITDYMAKGIVIGFLSKDDTFDEYEMQEKLLSVRHSMIPPIRLRLSQGDDLMDPSLLAMLALSVGTPFFTNVGASAGTIVGKYLGQQTILVLNRVFRGKITSPDDLQEDQLKAIATEQVSALTAQEVAALERETEESLRDLMNSRHFTVADLDDFYNGLGVHNESGMTPAQNLDYIRGTGERKNRANYLASWAYRHNKMGDLLALIRKEKPFLFEVVH
jgi:CheY-like chemotaxis protein